MTLHTGTAEGIQAKKRRKQFCCHHNGFKAMCHNIGGRFSGSVDGLPPLHPQAARTEGRFPGEGTRCVPLSPAAPGLPRAVAASSAATRLPKTPRCKLQKTRLEVVLPPELIPTLRALIASTPLMSLPLFCLPTPLAIAGPCLLSCPNVADKTL